MFKAGMLRIRVEKKEGTWRRWLRFPFAALPARMEARGIRLRPTLMWDRNCLIRYKIEEKDGGKFRLAGFIGLYNLDFRRSAEVAMEVLEGKRGKGIGKTSLWLFLRGIRKYGFAEEVVARVRPGNLPARRLLESMGFSEVLRQSGGVQKFRLEISSGQDSAGGMSPAGNQGTFKIQKISGDINIQDIGGKNKEVWKPWTD